MHAGWTQDFCLFIGNKYSLAVLETWRLECETWESESETDWKAGKKRKKKKNHNQKQKQMNVFPLSMLRKAPEANTIYNKVCFRFERKLFQLWSLDTAYLGIFFFFFLPPFSLISDYYLLNCKIHVVHSVGTKWYNSLFPLVSD